MIFTDFTLLNSHFRRQPLHKILQIITTWVSSVDTICPESNISTILFEWIFRGIDGRMTEVRGMRWASSRSTEIAGVYLQSSRTAKSFESCQRDSVQWWRQSSFSDYIFLCCVQCMCVWSVFLLRSAFVLDIYSRKLFTEVCLMNSLDSFEVLCRRLMFCECLLSYRMSSRSFPQEGMIIVQIPINFL